MLTLDILYDDRPIPNSSQYKCMIRCGGGEGNQVVSQQPNNRIIHMDEHTPLERFNSGSSGICRTYRMFMLTYQRKYLCFAQNAYKGLLH